MAHHLLIARFTMDDVPLRLFDSPICAETEAKRLHADQSLLETKWKNSMDAWADSPGDFICAVVLCIDAQTGYPRSVTYDSTACVEDIQPADPQPPQSTIPVPDGYVEIADPNHKLRPHVDFYLSLNWSPGEWISITETDGCLISDWGQPWRFACPADQHPDLQGTPLPTETDELAILRKANEILVKKQVEFVNDIEILRKANADLLAENNTLVATRTQLHKTVSELLEKRAEWMANNAPALEARYRQCERHAEELQAMNAILKKDNEHLRSSNIAFGERNAASQAEIRDLHAKVAHLQAEYNRVADLMANDNRAYGLLSTQNASLRQLNEDLNHRLNATLARASHATDLESRIRRMAINFVQFHAKLRERRVWSASFGAEKQMSPAYGQALMIAETAFADLLLSFLQSFPHVQPDMPDEWQIDPAKADDDDGTAD